MNTFQRARNLAHMRLEDTIFRKVPQNTDRTLVIIDMQSGFMDGIEDDIVPVICSLVCHAKQQEWAIIVAEFCGYGETDKEILDCLIGYAHWSTVYKKYCDGGQEVIECIRAHSSWSMDIIVCGIYGPQCVSETVCGIFGASDLVEVSVVTDAISPDYCSCTKESSEGLSQEKKVTTYDVVGSTQERGKYS